jgi:uncharacterized membrane protein
MTPSCTIIWPIRICSHRSFDATGTKFNRATNANATAVATTRSAASGWGGGPDGRGHQGRGR